MSEVYMIIDVKDVYEYIERFKSNEDREDGFSSIDLLDHALHVATMCMYGLPPSLAALVKQHDPTEGYDGHNQLYEYVEDHLADIDLTCSEATVLMDSVVMIVRRILMALMLDPVGSVHMFPEIHSTALGEVELCEAHRLDSKDTNKPVKTERIPFTFDVEIFVRFDDS